MGCKQVSQLQAGELAGLHGSPKENHDMRAAIRSIRMVALGTILLASAALAQRPQGSLDPEQMLDRQMSQLTEELTLTADQQEQVRPILKESFEKMTDLRTKSRDSGERPSPETREEMTKIREDTHEKLGKVFSKEQMEKYDKMLQERRNRFGRSRRGGETKDQ
jgi:hypothetical protein